MGSCCLVTKQANQKNDLIICWRKCLIRKTISWRRAWTLDHSSRNSCWKNQIRGSWYSFIFHWNRSRHFSRRRRIPNQIQNIIDQWQEISRNLLTTKECKNIQRKKIRWIRNYFRWFCLDQSPKSRHIRKFIFQ